MRPALQASAFGAGLLGGARGRRAALGGHGGGFRRGGLVTLAVRLLHLVVLDGLSGGRRLRRRRGGGWVAVHLRPAQTFLTLAAIALLLGAMGFLKPQAVFRGTYDQPLARGADLIGDIKRLLTHRAVYPAVLIMFMFQFGRTGSSTARWRRRRSTR